MGNSDSRSDAATVQEASRDSALDYSRLSGLRSASDDSILSENVFDSMLALERRRADRSNKPFVLMLLEMKPEDREACEILKHAADVALVNKREIDLVGWYSENTTLGVIFTEINLAGVQPVTEILRARIEAALGKHLGHEQAARIAISLHVFPGTWDKIQSDENRQLPPFSGRS